MAYKKLTDLTEIVSISMQSGKGVDGFAIITII